MSDDGKTRILKRENLPWGSPNTPPPTPDDDPTRKLRESQPAPRPMEPDDSRTQLIRPASRNTGPASSNTPDPMENPVVGWLVVTEGPGRGASLTIGYGYNSIGRDPSNRLALPYDDKEISREKHAMLVYDNRGRKFYAQAGTSTNLTYVCDEPLLMPRELKSGDTLRLGQTVLRFVAFCGAEFDWDQSASTSGEPSSVQPS